MPIFVKWLDFLEWLLQVTEAFPKRVRFTFSDRINQLSLDMVEDLVEVHYAREDVKGRKRRYVKGDVTL